MSDIYKTVPHINDLPVIEIDLIECLKVDLSLPKLVVKNNRPLLDFKLPF